LLKTLEIGLPSREIAPEEQREQVDRAQTHFVASCRELEDAGLAAQAPDAERYVAERLKWERRILSVAPVLGYTTDDVTRVERKRDTAGR